MWFHRRRETDKSVEAVQNASDVLDKVHARKKEVTELSQSFKHIRKQNGFADQLTQMMTTRGHKNA